MQAYKIRISEPKIGKLEKQLVLECLESNWISSRGIFIEQFEAEFAEKIGVPHAIATNNGTTALHLAVATLNLRPEQSVIVPNITYIASANCVRYQGAKVTLCEVDSKNMNINVNEIDNLIDETTVGLIPVHLYGKPANMDTIKDIAKNNDLWIVEDAAESLGAKIGSKSVGSFGNFGMFSFFGNKIITTGEGGMLVTSDQDLADRSRHLRGQAMIPDRQFWFDEVGFNYRMTNIQAAIGIGQLRALDRKLSIRRELVEHYGDSLASADWIEIVSSASPDEAPWLLNIKFQSLKIKEATVIALADAQIETRPIFPPLNLQSPYRSSRNFQESTKTYEHGLSLPLHENLSTKDISTIAAVIKNANRKTT